MIRIIMLGRQCCDQQRFIGDLGGDKVRIEEQTGRGKVSHNRDRKRGLSNGKRDGKGLKESKI